MIFSKSKKSGRVSQRSTESPKNYYWMIFLLLNDFWSLWVGEVWRSVGHSFMENWAISVFGCVFLCLFGVTLRFLIFQGPACQHVCLIVSLTCPSVGLSKGQSVWRLSKGQLVCLSVSLSRGQGPTVSKSVCRSIGQGRPQGSYNRSYFHLQYYYSHMIHVFALG